MNQPDNLPPDPENIEGPCRTPEEMAADARELNRIAPTPTDKFRLMLGATGVEARVDAMSDRPTPETDAVERGFTHNLRQDPQFRLTLHARHLERQRDAYAETLRAILRLCGDYDSLKTSRIGPIIKGFHPELAENAKSRQRCEALLAVMHPVINER